MNIGIQLLLTMLACSMIRRQRAVIEDLQEVTWAGFMEAATLVTPQTIMRWRRELIAKKYDGSKARRGSLIPDKEELQTAVSPFSAKPVRLDLVASCPTTKIFQL